MTAKYSKLLSPLRIRRTTISNRVVFAPTCPTWVKDPHEGIFTDQAVAYGRRPLGVRFCCGVVVRCWPKADI